MTTIEPTAEPIGLLPPVDRSDPRIAGLRRMRTVATTLLLAMAVVFVAASVLEGRWSWLGWARAFAEAAMVGACADWFAVVALFRHPLGLPIPHTAIVPRNKGRIGDTIGAFIGSNFLAPAVVRSRLATIDAVGWWAHQLADPKTAAATAQRAAGLLATLVEVVEREPIHGALCAATRRGLDAVSAAPLAARLLRVLLESGQLLILAERAIAVGDEALVRNKDMVRDKVAAHSAWWIPKWLDGKLADRVMSGVRGSLSELRAPDHPWRSHFSAFVEGLIQRLDEDPEMIATAERIKAEILANPAVAGWVDMLWREVEARLKSSGDGGALAAGLEHALGSVGSWLQTDAALRATLNGWIQRTAESTVVPHRAEIGRFIAGVVKHWDDRTLVDKIELTV
ncbi:MAG: DUF445 domain-containing protein, partial [Alphaproteobacteria bacterium]|nr:DUF445 domain-containing protein [Alphaproteobacteria bacterium]